MKNVFAQASCEKPTDRSLRASCPSSCCAPAFQGTLFSFQMPLDPLRIQLYRIHYTPIHFPIYLWYSFVLVFVLMIVNCNVQPRQIVNCPLLLRNSDPVSASFKAWPCIGRSVYPPPTSAQEHMLQCAIHLPCVPSSLFYSASTWLKYWIAKYPMCTTLF